MGRRRSWRQSVENQKGRFMRVSFLFLSGTNYQIKLEYGMRDGFILQGLDSEVVRADRLSILHLGGADLTCSAVFSCFLVILDFWTERISPIHSILQFLSLSKFLLQLQHAEITWGRSPDQNSEYHPIAQAQSPHSPRVIDGQKSFHTVFTEAGVFSTRSCRASQWWNNKQKSTSRIS